MDIEKLKICAKTVGCKYIHHYSFEHDGFYVSRDNKVFLYDPEHNDAQNRELELLLLDKGWLIWKARDMYICCDNNGMEICGKTLNQAVINAVVEMNHGG